MGTCRGCPPQPTPERPASQRRGPPRPPQSCRCQRSSWGASVARRAAAPAPRPPRPAPGRSPRRAGSAHRAHPPLAPSRPDPRGCGLTASRVPARPLGARRPRADKSASWRPHQPSVGLLNPAPARPFEMPDPKLLRSGSPPPFRNSRLPRRPTCPPPGLHPHPAPEELRRAGGGAPGPQYTRRHLPEENGGCGSTCDTTAAGAPSLMCAHPPGENHSWRV